MHIKRVNKMFFFSTNQEMFLLNVPQKPIFSLTHIFFNTDYHNLMLTVGRDDLRNRIPPRLRDFYTNDLTIQYDNEWKPGVVNWHKAHMLKSYCQERNGYTCQRPSVSMETFGKDHTGK